MSRIHRTADWQSNVDKPQLLQPVHADDSSGQPAIVPCVRKMFQHRRWLFPMT
jgi:hypothetical protein